MKEKLSNIDQLNENIKMYFKRQKMNKNDGLFTQEEEIDEFDKIILHISMHEMVNPLSVDQILHKDDIRDIFMKRVKSGDIPSASFIAYI